jgi:hypothetical protein
LILKLLDPSDGTPSDVGDGHESTREILVSFKPNGDIEPAGRCIGPANCGINSEALAAVNGEDSPGKDEDLERMVNGDSTGLVHDSSRAGSDTLLVGRSRSESAASDLSRWMKVFLTA